MFIHICSITIVRVLSGYYTLNAKMWRSMNSNFDNYYNKTFQNEKNNNFPNWTYIKTYGEPQRFNTFIKELISSPKKFTDSMHHNHILSTTEVLQQHLGNPYTKLSFIGKVENFNNDVIKLINSSFCSNYFNVENDIKVLDKQFISHQMKGFDGHFQKVGKMNGNII